MLYVAPETLTKQENLEFFSDLTISFFAVDERIVFLNGDMIFVLNIAGYGK
jgi:hypothetical protein